MYDFIMQLFSHLNIDPNVIDAYDAFITILSGFSFLVTLVGWGLKRIKFLHVDAMVTDALNNFR